MVEAREARERRVRQRRRELACNEAVRVRRVAYHQHLNCGEGDIGYEELISKVQVGCARFCTRFAQVLMILKQQTHFADERLLRC